MILSHRSSCTISCSFHSLVSKLGEILYRIIEGYFLLPAPFPALLPHFCSSCPSLCSPAPSCPTFWLILVLAFHSTSFCIDVVLTHSFWVFFFYFPRWQVDTRPLPKTRLSVPFLNQRGCENMEMASDWYCSPIPVNVCLLKLVEL